MNTKTDVSKCSTLKKSGREAATAGEKQFFTNKPCLRGHLSPRWTQTGSCITCAAMHAKEAMRRRRKALRDLIAGAK